MKEEFEKLYKLRSQGLVTAQKAREAISALTAKEESLYVRTKAESDSDSSNNSFNILSRTVRKGMVHPTNPTTATIGDLPKFGTGKTDPNLRQQQQQQKVSSPMESTTNNNSNITSLHPDGEGDKNM
jgi:hypothetical protein